MRLLRRKKKKEWFNQKLIHAAKIHHLIHQSQIVITKCRVIRSAVLVNNSVDMCEFHFRRKASYAVYF